MELLMRAFENCPGCKKYIAPGFRTDACPFCGKDFTTTPEYQKQKEEDLAFFKGFAIGRIRNEMAEFGITKEDIGL